MEERSPYAFLKSIAIVGAALIIQGFAVYRRADFFDTASTVFSAANNSAFVLLHSKLPSDAEKMLQSSLERRGAGVYELANLGLALSLNGDPQRGEAYFSAANLWARSNKVKALIEFNKSVVAANNRDFPRANEHLKQAIALKRSLVVEYGCLSEYIMEARRADTYIDKTMNEAGAKPL